MAPILSPLRLLVALATLACIWTAPVDAQQRSSNLPSLRLQVTAKRSSMKVHGLSTFEVLANPIQVNGQVTFNGVSTFYENGKIYTYKLLNGVVYMSVATNGQESTQCAAANSLPAVQDLLEAINTVSSVSGVQSEETIDCSNGQLLETKLAGEPLVLCTASTGLKVYSGDFDVDVTFVVNAISITPPTMLPEELAACDRSVSAATLTPSTIAILTGQKTSFKPTETTVVLPEATCACKGTRRPCLFIHGLGNADNNGLVDSSDYFGDIASHAPCCSSVKFTALNTQDNEWYQDAIQQRVCDLALTVSGAKNTSTIANTIIVTHSMGNLLVAGAVATGKCSLAPSTSWVGLSGPMIGSMASDYLIDTCANGGFMGFIASIIGRCPANLSTQSMVYQTESKATSALRAKYAAAQAVYAKSVSAVMCSNSPAGLFGWNQLPLQTAAKIIPHKSKENDGVVEYQSCANGIPLSNFAATYTSKFYVTALNHLDTAFRNGDSLSNNAQKPVKWFECLL